MQFYLMNQVIKFCKRSQMDFMDLHICYWDDIANKSQYAIGILNSWGHLQMMHM